MDWVRQINGAICILLDAQQFLKIRHNTHCFHSARMKLFLHEIWIFHAKVISCGKQERRAAWATIPSWQNRPAALCRPLLLHICNYSFTECLKAQPQTKFRSVFTVIVTGFSVTVCSLCRGCSCRHGRQRRAVGSGGQPGQRVDPQTRLQEHTRCQQQSSFVEKFHWCWHPCRRFSVVCVVSTATYVKVYVLENGVCLSKKKTKVVKKNLDPTYQQALLFDESPQGKVLQVSEPLYYCVHNNNNKC